MIRTIDELNLPVLKEDLAVVVVPRRKGKDNLRQEKPEKNIPNPGESDPPKSRQDNLHGYWWAKGHSGHESRNVS